MGKGSRGVVRRVPHKRVVKVPMKEAGQIGSLSFAMRGTDALRDTELNLKELKLYGLNERLVCLYVQFTQIISFIDKKNVSRHQDRVFKHVDNLKEVFKLIDRDLSAKTPALKIRELVEKLRKERFNRVGLNLQESIKFKKLVAVLVLLIAKSHYSETESDQLAIISSEYRSALINYMSDRMGEASSHDMKTSRFSDVRHYFTKMRNSVGAQKVDALLYAASFERKFDQALFFDGIEGAQVCFTALMGKSYSKLINSSHVFKEAMSKFGLTSAHLDYLLTPSGFSQSPLVSFSIEIKRNLRDDAFIKEHAMSVCILFVLILEKLANTHKSKLDTCFDELVSLIDVLFDRYLSIDPVIINRDIQNTNHDLAKATKKNMVRLLDGLAAGFGADQINLEALQIDNVHLQDCMNLVLEKLTMSDSAVSLTLGSYQKKRSERVVALECVEKFIQDEDHQKATIGKGSIRRAPRSVKVVEEGKGDDSEDENPVSVSTHLRAIDDVNRLTQAYFEEGIINGDPKRLSDQYTELFCLMRKIEVLTNDPTQSAAINQLNLTIADWCTLQYRAVDCAKTIMDARSVKKKDIPAVIEKIKIGHYLLDSAVKYYKRIDAPKFRAEVYRRLKFAKDQFTRLKISRDCYLITRKALIAEINTKRAQGRIAPATGAISPYNQLVEQITTLSDEFDRRGDMTVTYQSFLEVDVPVVKSAGAGTERPVAEWAEARPESPKLSGAQLFLKQRMEAIKTQLDQQNRDPLSEPNLERRVYVAQSTSVCTGSSEFLAL